MKDILPGMTVHLTVGNYTDMTITVNGHKMTYTSIYEIGLGDTQRMRLEQSLVIKQLTRWCRDWQLKLRLKFELMQSHQLGLRLVYGGD